MTGKEAYKELVEKLGDMLSQCEADDINPFLVVIYQNINKLEEKDKELYKYKRAFEILKDKFNLRLMPLLIVDDEIKSMCLDYNGDYRRPLISLDDEEAELLEELMDYE